MGPALAWFRPKTEKPILTLWQKTAPAAAWARRPGAIPKPNITLAAPPSTPRPFPAPTGWLSDPASTEVSGVV